MTSTPGGNKRIFISDIHMGDERSMKPVSPHLHSYGWLQKNIIKLTNFLHDQLHAQDVGQVVILGDLFDQWVIPTDLDPLPILDGIVNNPDNKGIIDNLKGLAHSSKLSYVPGNHDMSVCSKDIGGMKKFLEKTFPGIHFICNDGLPTGVYREGQLVAEHGNMYCLFNAPDTWTAPGSFLPLGYFISRMVAYKVAQTGQSEDSMDILGKFIDLFKEKPNFVYDLALAVAADAGLNESDKINMGNMSGFPASITINEVANKYMNLMHDWDKNQDIIGSDIALIGDSFLGLFEAAYTVYLRPGTDINIVVFGHTHAWRNEDVYPSPDENENGTSHPSKAIYANSGTWIDSKFCTYVETEADEDNQRHYVRVKSYPGNQLLQELFVNL
jgi:UDP-2,3-diacylglucosamine pyrophosphatase LpxH